MSRSMLPRLIASAVACCLLLAACGSDDGGGDAATSSTTSPPGESTTSEPVPLVPPVGDVAEYAPSDALDTIAKAPDTTHEVVALFGDSLVQQSLSYATTIAKRRGYSLVGGGYGGLALCDTIDSLRRSIIEEHPSVVVLAFVGNAISPCILADGEDPSAGELAGRYARDARLAIRMSTEAGARVVLVAPPRMRKPDRDNIARAIGNRWNHLAETIDDVTVVDASAVLTPDGYTDTLPCAGWETADLGCDDGEIVVRADDGTHLVTPFGTSDYSAGAWRYATVLMSDL